ncbi:MAG: hypothetical protein VKK05_01535 [Synechococcus sp.]|jgi:hypothetical protein|nr:hypothetical protein [Synechococcus sp.]
MAWEYRVIHINVESSTPPGPPNPKADSERLGGALSPDYLKREFPQQYSAEAQKPRHPAEQLTFFLNALGKENWEMVEAAQVGPLLMFFFKRPMREPPKVIASSEPAPQS